MKIRKKSREFSLFLWGVLAGAVNGLLGAGGGILIVRCASRLLPAEYAGQRDVLATALTVMLPVSAVSCMVYALRGALPVGEPGMLLRFGLSGVAGGILGALLLGRIDERVLRLIFAGITVWSGISMLT